MSNQKAVKWFLIHLMTLNDLDLDTLAHTPFVLILKSIEGNLISQQSPFVLSQVRLRTCA